jgi:hypothetical protein
VAYAPREALLTNAVPEEGQVDAALHRVVVGVERGRDVGAVQPEVEGEVVAGTGRHADERDVMPPGDVRDQSLRAVAAGHPDHVRASGDGLLGERSQVVPALQHHRRHTPASCLLLQAEPLDLPAARPRVHDQDALPGRPHEASPGRRGREVVADRHPGGRRGHQDEQDHRDDPQHRAGEQQARWTP